MDHPKMSSEQQQQQRQHERQQQYEQEQKQEIFRKAPVPILSETRAEQRNHPKPLTNQSDISTVHDKKPTTIVNSLMMSTVTTKENANNNINNNNNNRVSSSSSTNNHDNANRVRVIRRAMNRSKSADDTSNFIMYSEDRPLNQQARTTPSLRSPSKNNPVIVSASDKNNNASGIRWTATTSGQSNPIETMNRSNASKPQRLSSPNIPRVNDPMQEQQHRHDQQQQQQQPSHPPRRRRLKQELELPNQEHHEARQGWQDHTKRRQQQQQQQPLDYDGQVLRRRVPIRTKSLDSPLSFGRPMNTGRTTPNDDPKKRRYRMATASTPERTLPQQQQAQKVPQQLELRSLSPVNIYQRRFARQTLVRSRHSFDSASSSHHSTDTIEVIQRLRCDSDDSNDTTYGYDPPPTEIIGNHSSGSARRRGTRRTRSTDGTMPSFVHSSSMKSSSPPHHINNNMNGHPPHHHTSSAVSPSARSHSSYYSTSSNGSSPSNGLPPPQTYQGGVKNTGFRIIPPRRRRTPRKPQPLSMRSMIRRNLILLYRYMIRGSILQPPQQNRNRNHFWNFFKVVMTVFSISFSIAYMSTRFSYRNQETMLLSSSSQQHQHIMMRNMTSNEQQHHWQQHPQIILLQEKLRQQQQQKLQQQQHEHDEEQKKLKQEEAEEDDPGKYFFSSNGFGWNYLFSPVRKMFQHHANNDNSHEFDKEPKIRYSPATSPMISGNHVVVPTKNTTTSGTVSKSYHSSWLQIPSILQWNHNQDNKNHDNVDSMVVPHLRNQQTIDKTDNSHGDVLDADLRDNKHAIGKQLRGTVKGMDPKQHHDHRIDALTREDSNNNNNEVISGIRGNTRPWKNLSHVSTELTNLTFHQYSDNAPTCHYIPSNNISFTLVTQLSLNRLWMMEHHCTRWSMSSWYYPEDNMNKTLHPISMAVFVGDNTSVTLEWIYHELEAMECPIEAITVETLDGYSEEEYPVNVLRNIALSNVRTSHVVYVDIDFWPSIDLYDTLETYRDYLSDHIYTALVIPAFQLNRQCKGVRDCREKNIPKMPYFKNQLSNLILHRQASPFDPTNRGGHGSTRYKDWIEQPSGTLIPIECVISNRYEPYTVFRYCNHVPPFQEVFTGYGKNKMTWTMQLLYSGYKLYQISTSFVIHYPHLESSARLKWNGGVNGEAMAKPKSLRRKPIMNDNHNHHHHNDMNEKEEELSSGDVVAQYKRAQIDETFVRFRDWLIETYGKYHHNMNPNNDNDEQYGIRKVLKCTDGTGMNDDDRLWIDRSKNN